MSNTFLRLGALFALAGVGLGYWMGVTEEFGLMPVHAHVNLLGWVSMFLYGLFYRAVPQAAAGWLARAHLWTAALGLLLFMPALTLKLLHAPGAESLALAGLIAGPSLTVVAFVLFTVIVFRHTGGRAAATAA
jgi:Cbb3-type cytochrome oxidase, subunit 1